MNTSGKDSHEEDDIGDIFLDDEDIIQEIDVDNDDLPDADDEEGGSESTVTEDDDSLHTFNGHTDEVYAVACSPSDPLLVATGGKDDCGFVWKIGQGEWAFELQGHRESVSALAFSNDGLLLASGSLDGVIKVWDLPLLNLKCTVQGPRLGIEWLRWHPRGHLILAASEDYTMCMWNADSCTSLNVFFGHTSNVTCGDFTPDGKLICSGSDDATLRVWNPKTAETLHVVRGHPYHTEGLTCMAMKAGAAGSTFAITGSTDGSVHIVNINTGKVVSTLIFHLDPSCPETAHLDSVECVAFAPSFPWAATGGLDQKLFIWDLDHSAPRSVCYHPDGVTCFSWIGLSRYIATGCLDGKVRIWDSLSGQCAKTFSGHSKAIQALAVSANFDLVLSCSLDGTARVFEIHDLTS